MLPLVPGYLGFVSGMAAGDRASSRRWRTAVGALLFVAGFTAVFVLMALFVTSVGRGLWEHKDLLMRLGATWSSSWAWSSSGGPLDRHPARHPPALAASGRVARGSRARGIFALGWAPCTGPTLAAVLILATSTQGSIQRPRTGPHRCLLPGPGHPLPARRRGRRPVRPVRWLARHRRGIQVFGGVLLIAIGLLLVTGWWDWLTTWLQTELIDNFVVPL